SSWCASHERPACTAIAPQASAATSRTALRCSARSERRRAIMAATARKRNARRRPGCCAPTAPADCPPPAPAPGRPARTGRCTPPANGRADGTSWRRHSPMHDDGTTAVELAHRDRHFLAPPRKEQRLAASAKPWNGDGRADEAGALVLL